MEADLYKKQNNTTASKKCATETKYHASKSGARTESWTGQEESVYTYEERMWAVKAYIASGFRLNRTIAQLGYPSHQGLRDWYKEYAEKGDLHRDYIRESQYTQQQKEEAIEHYYANGRNLSKTSKALG